MSEVEHPIILFDALCVLCCANARFVLRHDRRAHFRLASMQSEAGAALFARFGMDPADPESLIVVIGDKALRDSEAVLAIWRGLGWPWRAAAALRIVPRVIRDGLYRWLVRNRYRLFGRRRTCWVPEPGQRERLL
jgi:predicted DCC family thiol-disulfide oxidoreductase YuxK